MTKTKQIFGEQVDLAYYYDKWNPEDPEVQAWFQKKFGGELEGFLFVDLHQKDETDDEFTNVGVRDEQNTGTAIEDMQYSYRQDGWLIDEFPPIVDSYVEFDDGRTRALSAIREGERYIPAARIKKPDNTKRSKFTTGIKSNYFTPRRRVVSGDFIVAGAELISKHKELKRDEPSIENWLYNDLDIESIYPSNVGGTITKIVNAIMNRTEGGRTSLIRKINRDDWLTWLETCHDMRDESNNKIHPTIQQDHEPDFILLDGTSNTNEARLLYRILENTLNNRHTYIVLWTKKDAPSETIRRQFKDFVTATESSHANMIRYAQNSINLIGIDLTKMENKKLFTFLGALPILLDGNGHEKAYKQRRLMPIDEF